MQKKRSKAEGIAESLCSHAVTKDAKEPHACERVDSEWTEDGYRVAVESLKKITTPEQAMRKAGIDPKIWRPVKTVVNSWEVVLKLPDGKGGFKSITKPLWQVKVELHRRVPEESVNAFEALAKILPRLSLAPVQYKKKRDASRLLIGCADFHFGKATVDKKGSLSAVERLFDRMTNHMIDQAASADLSHIYFINLGDLLHCDNDARTTTNGTPQDTVAGFHEIYEAAQTSMIKALERCRQVAPTTMVTTQGNHDWAASQHISSAMKAVFRGTRGITIDNSPDSRKYLDFGVNLVGMAHGCSEKITMYPGLMSMQRPMEWGRTSNRIFLRGHLHHRQAMRTHDTLEQDGCVVYTLPSPSGADGWHDRSGFVGNKRCVQSFLLSEKWGTQAIYEASVAELVGEI